MDLLTVAIFVCLVLAAVGAYVVIGFFRYKSYFTRVRHLLIATGAEDIWHLPQDKLADVDDVVRRSYFAKDPLPLAAAKAGEVLWRKPVASQLK